jgi:Mg-chelatase subunit ChlD
MEKHIIPNFDFTKAMELSEKDNGITILAGRMSSIQGYVYLVIDCSGSMDGEKLDSVKKGAANFALDAKIKSYFVGLIKFDSNATHLVEPQSNLSEIYDQLESMDTNGSTNMTDAISMATEKLKIKDGARIMIIATDGMPDNKESAIEAAQLAKKKGVEIIAIGTDDADADFLKKIASTDTLGIKVSNNQLGQALASTVKALKSPERIT